MPQKTAAEYKTISETAEVRPFLDVIGWSEGANYKKLVGGGSFTSFADHPRKKVWIASIKDYSTAAGKYQILEDTWDEVAAELNLTDFSPVNQDIAAVYLIDKKKALDEIYSGDIASAISLTSWIWASFPPSRYKQKTKGLSTLLAKYNSFKSSSAAAAVVTPSLFHILIYFGIVACIFMYGVNKNLSRRQKINLSKVNI